MRIFAFGCSLSQYFYPTWADVAIYEYKQKGYHGENWSRSGAGNQYIFTRLWANWLKLSYISVRFLRSLFAKVLSFFSVSTP